MTNKQLQSILTNYPDGCEIVTFMDGEPLEISQICAEYDEDDDFTTPALVIYLRQ